MSASSSAEATAVPGATTLPSRVRFRFVFLFLVQHLLFFVPFVVEYSTTVWNPLVQLVHKTEVLPNGSGDTTWNWVHLFLTLAIAATGTIVWSLIDRRATDHARLRAGLRVACRFGLAMAMISYATVKLIQTQFPPPSLDRLLQPFGQASPMGLLWTFMGASYGYNLFTGAGELLGGLLLTTRRTTLAGALLCAAIMTHVLVLNLCYDVPVKIFSALLLFVALYLIAPDAKRLVAVLFAGPERAAAWKIGLRTTFVLAFVGFGFYEAYGFSQMRLAKSQYYGIWSVDDAVMKDVRWRRVVFDYKDTVSVYMLDDTRQRYRIEGSLLKRRDDPKFSAPWAVKRVDANTLTLFTRVDGKSIHATLKKEPPREFPLTSRGFHWISEYPFNR
jgi:hypothetical protein